MPARTPNWRRRAARRAKTVVCTGIRTRGIDRCARVSISPGCRMRCAMVGATLPLLDALGHLAKPGTVMLPRPPWRDPAARHGANRPFDPNPGVNMYNNGADQYKTEKRVRQRPEPHQLDGEVTGEVLPPNEDARQQQTGQTNHNGKIQQFLAAVVAPDLRQVLLSVVHHVLHLAQPDP